jgi:hypothetical protein
VLRPLANAISHAAGAIGQSAPGPVVLFVRGQIIYNLDEHGRDDVVAAAGIGQQSSSI